MSKDSEKIKLLKCLCLQNALDLVDIDSDSDHEEDLIMDFAMNAALILQNRESTHFDLPKLIHWDEEILPNFDEGRMLLVSRHEFYHIMSIIEKDSVFQNNGRSPQLPIHLQLKIALFRFGSNGDNASIRMIADIFGVEDGETVIIVTKRVIHAILNLKSKYLFWPTTEERKKIVARTMHELPGCIGYIDGTEIRLAEAPAINDELYFSRKKQYSLKMQVVCDNRLKIRHAVIGHHGNVHEARIFAECSIGQAPERFLSEKQYITGDSAYPLSQYVITPFRQNSTEFTEDLRARFNEYFFKFRVRVENCIDKLKEKFCSLKELRFRIQDEDNHKDCCNWILACCILHNILIDFESPEESDISDHVEYPQQMNSTKDIRAALVEFISKNSNNFVI